MNRIVVVGSSGSGKTTTARHLAALLDVPLLELDAVMHDGDWNATPDDEFQRRIAEFTSADRWVVDGNYTSHGTHEVLWPKADTFVWLDPPRRVVMSRVIRRTLTRMITRERLWGGELTEPISNLYKRDPYENIIVWAWTRFEPTRAKFEAAMTDGTWAHAGVYRIRSKYDSSRFINQIRPPVG